MLLGRGEARVTAVKKGPAPADAPPAVPGGGPAEVVVEVEATMVSGGASVTAKPGEILQVCWKERAGGERGERGGGRQRGRERERLRGKHRRRDREKERKHKRQRQIERRRANP